VLISAANDVIGLLADPVRTRIVEMLARGPACVCHLVDELDLKQPNVSNHVRVLRQAGLIRGETRGRFTFYHLNTQPLRAAATHLAALADAAETNAARYRECT
jgi:ArsR family transcriptional regulator